MKRDIIISTQAQLDQQSPELKAAVEELKEVQHAKIMADLARALDAGGANLSPAPLEQGTLFLVVEKYDLNQLGEKLWKDVQDDLRGISKHTDQESANKRETHEPDRDDEDPEAQLP